MVDEYDIVPVSILHILCIGQKDNIYKWQHFTVRYWQDEM